MASGSFPWLFHWPITEGPSWDRGNVDFSLVSAVVSFWPAFGQGVIPVALVHIPCLHCHTAKHCWVLSVLAAISQPLEKGNKDGDELFQQIESSCPSPAKNVAF